MTTSRLAVLLAILLVGLSSVFLLPKQLGQQPVGVTAALPEYIGEWWGHDMEILEKERQTLGLDTQFARKLYSNGRGANVLASIVLAGQDMMMAIHRPERCLAAQGWTFGNPERRFVDVPGRGHLAVTRVHNSKFVKDADGKAVEIENVCYYWFVGSRDITPSHLARVWYDSRDRLMGGYVQRWAMIMISSDITAGREKFGRDERQTDELLVDFAKKVVPVVHNEGLLYH